MVRSNIPSAPYNAAILAGVTATAGELNTVDVTTAGTAQASKAVILDANKDVTSLRNVTATGAVQGATLVGTTSVTAPIVAGAAHDAGASGTAGSVDIFPGTASRGKIALTAANSAGDTTTTIVNASQAAARTYTIPDALASAAQFLLGMQGAVARTASADGTGDGTIADAGKIQFITVTSDHADKIIILPTPTPGTIVGLMNGGTGYEIRSSAPATVAINGGTEANGESAIGANVFVLLFCVTATAWLGINIGTNGALAVTQVAAAA